MIPHPCLIGQHDPPRQYGDCLRACIASFFDVPDIETVPHFFMNGDEQIATDMLRTWLSEHGFRAARFIVDGDAPSDDVFAWMKETNPGVQYLMFCTSGGTDHVVICKDDKVIHNPAWIRSHISGPHSCGAWIFMVFVPIMS